MSVEARFEKKVGSTSTNLYAGTPGRAAHDEIFYNPDKKRYFRKTNHAGGIEGGMSNGNAIVFRAVMKPIPTVMTPLATVNITTKEPEVAVKERSDITAVPACGVVIENVTAIVIANALIDRYGGGDIASIRHNLENDPVLKEFEW